MPRSRFLFYVINPHSGVGTGRYARTRIKDLVREGREEAEIRSLHHHDDIREIVRDGIAKGATDIIAVGGDGTVSGVAGAVARKNVNMGIVPVGTANMLARELGIPLTVAGSLRVIHGRHSIRHIDAMEIGEERYVYQIVLGPSSEALSRLTPVGKKLFGRYAYVLAGMRMLADFHPLWTYGMIDGKEVRMWASQIMIANAGILGAKPFRVGPDVRADDGKVEVVIMKGRTRTSFVTAGIDLVTGNYYSKNGLRYFSARDHIRLKCEPRTLVKADGEFIGPTPVEIRILPRAVNIIVPPLNGR